MSYSRSIRLVLLLAALLGSMPSVRAATVLRTLTYHQITDGSTFDASPSSPILSANGSRAAFSLPPTGDVAENRICVINPDGTGFKQIDSYAPLCFCGSVVDISADGSKVVSTDSVQIRIVNGNGTGLVPLITIGGNEINDLAISGDGTKVFFRIYRSTARLVNGQFVPIENGIYVINANGSGLRQIAGPTQLSALLGMPASEFGFFGNGSFFSALRTSHDGGRLVFACLVSPRSGGAGQRLFGVNLDGSGLRDYFGQLDWVFQATISSDGTKVGYTIEPTTGPPDEVGTLNFDGSGRIKLADSSQGLPNTGGGFYTSKIQLTSNGSKLLISETGLLFNTDGSGAVPLSLRFLNADSYLLSDGLYQGRMNGDASKALYLFTPNGLGRNVFARVDVNPASLGVAPSLTQPSVDPGFVVMDSASTSTLSVRATSPVTDVGSRFITGPLNLPDNNIGSGTLRDDGLNGDAVAGDRLFTHNGLFANCCAVVGPHTIRLKGEFADAGGKLHATAIDFDQVSVVPAPPPLPKVSINNVRVAEGDSGTTNLTFTLTLSAAAQQTGTVDFATASGSATPGSDYTSKNGTVTFSPGQTTQTITVSVTGDTVEEIDETLYVNLTNPNKLVIDKFQGQGTIVNDDGPALSINDVTVIEGNGGSKTANFTVTLAPASSKTVTVKYATANDSATQPGDYASAAGTLTFAPGETSKTVAVTVNGDTLDEINETFFVNLSSPTNAPIGDALGVGTITDDDLPPSVRIDDVSTVEGSSGTKNLTFTVTLSAVSGQNLSVQYATADGTATAGSDYTALPLTTLSFVPGQISRPVIVPIKGDTVKESTEKFVVNLSNPINVTIADAQGTGTIVDDDTNLSLSVNDVAISEGNAGNKAATFTVTLSVPSTKTVTVQYETVLPGSFVATPGTDYIAVPLTTLTFAPGETTMPVTVQIIGDTLDEVDERYLVKLSSPVNAVIVDGEGRGTITDDDAAPTLSIGDVTIIEGNSGTKPATFTATLSAVSSKAVTVQYTTATAGSAAATGGADYIGVPPTTLTFAPGETTKSFAVQVKGDTVDEVDERFLVKLLNPVNATFADSEARCTITDDDPAPLLNDEPSE